MKITVLNGSPKGDTSVTMQYIRYARKLYPDNTCHIHDISRGIKVIEKDPGAFRAVLEDVRSSELVIWAFPLYYLLVPSQYKRFIELVFERKGAAAFRSKYAAVITTSIHFFDHTAHNYMRAICDDLAMKFAGSYSAAMYDLVRSRERKRFDDFLACLFDTMRDNTPAARAYYPVSARMSPYRPSPPKNRINPEGKNIVIITDASSPSSNLGRMADRLRQSFTEEPPAYNLHDLKIKGGCLGCLQCAYDNRCVYGDSDDFHLFFESRIKAADIIFYCMETRDRYLSSLWKRFIDRSFYNNHTPVLEGKQVGCLVSGPLGKLSSFHEFLRAFPEIQHASLVDIVTDEGGDSRDLDLQIQNLARNAVARAARNYMGPLTFQGVGGWKIFRDEIWGWLRFPFIADHRYYRKHGMYDFPKRRFAQSLVNGALSVMVKLPAFRDVVYRQRMKDEMLRPFRTILKL